MDATAPDQPSTSTYAAAAAVPARPPPPSAIPATGILFELTPAEKQRRAELIQAARRFLRRARLRRSKRFGFPRLHYGPDNDALRVWRYVLLNSKKLRRRRRKQQRALVVRDLRAAGIDGVRHRVRSHLACPICHRVMFEATFAPLCMHRFCFACVLGRIEAGNYHCAVCDAFMSPTHGLTRDHRIDAIIANLGFDLNDVVMPREEEDEDDPSLPLIPSYEDAVARAGASFSRIARETHRAIRERRKTGREVAATTARLRRFATRHGRPGRALADDLKTRLGIRDLITAPPRSRSPSTVHSTLIAQLASIEERAVERKARKEADMAPLERRKERMAAAGGLGRIRGGGNSVADIRRAAKFRAARAHMMMRRRAAARLSSQSMVPGAAEATSASPSPSSSLAPPPQSMKGRRGNIGRSPLAGPPASAVDQMASSSEHSTFLCSPPPPSSGATFHKEPQYATRQPQPQPQPQLPQNSTTLSPFAHNISSRPLNGTNGVTTSSSSSPHPGTVGGGLRPPLSSMSLVASYGSAAMQSAMMTESVAPHQPPPQLPGGYHINNPRAGPTPTLTAGRQTTMMHRQPLHPAASGGAAASSLTASPSQPGMPQAAFPMMAHIGGQQQYQRQPIPFMPGPMTPGFAGSSRDPPPFQQLHQMMPPPPPPPRLPDTTQLTTAIRTPVSSLQQQGGASGSDAGVAPVAPAAAAAAPPPLLSAEDAPEGAAQQDDDMPQLEMEGVDAGGGVTSSPSIAVTSSPSGGVTPSPLMLPVAVIRGGLQRTTKQEEGIAQAAAPGSILVPLPAASHKPTQEELKAMPLAMAPPKSRPSDTVATTTTSQSRPSQEPPGQPTIVPQPAAVPIFPPPPPQAFPHSAPGTTAVYGAPQQVQQVFPPTRLVGVRLRDPTKEVEERSVALPGPFERLQPLPPVTFGMKCAVRKEAALAATPSSSSSSDIPRCIRLCVLPDHIFPNDRIHLPKQLLKPIYLMLPPETRIGHLQRFILDKLCKDNNLEFLRHFLHCIISPVMLEFPSADLAILDSDDKLTKKRHMRVELMRKFSEERERFMKLTRRLVQKAYHVASGFRRSVKSARSERRIRMVQRNGKGRVCRLSSSKERMLLEKTAKTSADATGVSSTADNNSALKKVSFVHRREGASRQRESPASSTTTTSSTNSDEPSTSRASRGISILAPLAQKKLEEERAAAAARARRPVLAPVAGARLERDEDKARAIEIAESLAFIAKRSRIETTRKMSYAEVKNMPVLANIPTSSSSAPSTSKSGVAAGSSSAAAASTAPSAVVGRRSVHEQPRTLGDLVHMVGKRKVRVEMSNVASSSSNNSSLPGLDTVATVPPSSAVPSTSTVAAAVAPTKSTSPTSSVGSQQPEGNGASSSSAGVVVGKPTLAQKERRERRIREKARAASSARSSQKSSDSDSAIEARHAANAAILPPMPEDSRPSPRLLAADPRIRGYASNPPAGAAAAATTTTPKSAGAPPPPPRQGSCSCRHRGVPLTSPTTTTANANRPRGPGESISKKAFKIEKGSFCVVTSSDVKRACNVHLTIGQLWQAHAARDATRPFRLVYSIIEDRVALQRGVGFRSAFNEPIPTERRVDDTLGISGTLEGDHATRALRSLRERPGRLSVAALCDLIRDEKKKEFGEVKRLIAYCKCRVEEKSHGGRVTPHPPPEITFNTLNCNVIRKVLSSGSFGGETILGERELARLMRYNVLRTRHTRQYLGARARLRSHMERAARELDTARVEQLQQLLLNMSRHRINVQKIIERVDAEQNPLPRAFPRRVVFGRVPMHRFGVLGRRTRQRVRVRVADTVLRQRVRVADAALRRRGITSVRVRRAAISRLLRGGGGSGHQPRSTCLGGEHSSRIRRVGTRFFIRMGKKQLSFGGDEEMTKEEDEDDLSLAAIRSNLNLAPSTTSSALPHSQSSSSLKQQAQLAQKKKSGKSKTSKNRTRRRNGKEEAAAQPPLKMENVREDDIVQPGLGPLLHPLGVRPWRLEVKKQQQAQTNGHHNNSKNNQPSSSMLAEDDESSRGSAKVGGRADEDEQSSSPPQRQQQQQQQMRAIRLPVMRQLRQQAAILCKKKEIRDQEELQRDEARRRQLLASSYVAKKRGESEEENQPAKVAENDRMTLLRSVFASKHKKKANSTATEVTKTKKAAADGGQPPEGDQRAVDQRTTDQRLPPHVATRVVKHLLAYADAAHAASLGLRPRPASPNKMATSSSGEPSKKTTRLAASRQEAASSEPTTPTALAAPAAPATQPSSSTDPIQAVLERRLMAPGQRRLTDEQMRLVAHQKHMVEKDPHLVAIILGAAKKQQVAVAAEPAAAAARPVIRDSGGPYNRPPAAAKRPGYPVTPPPRQPLAPAEAQIMTMSMAAPPPIVFPSYHQLTPVMTMEPSSSGFGFGPASAGPTAIATAGMPPHAVQQPSLSALHQKKPSSSPLKLPHPRPKSSPSPPLRSPERLGARPIPPSRPPPMIGQRVADTPTPPPVSQAAAAAASAPGTSSSSGAAPTAAPVRRPSNADLLKTEATTTTLETAGQQSVATTPSAAAAAQPSQQQQQQQQQSAHAVLRYLQQKRATASRRSSCKVKVVLPGLAIDDSDALQEKSNAILKGVIDFSKELERVGYLHRPTRRERGSTRIEGTAAVTATVAMTTTAEELSGGASPAAAPGATAEDDDEEDEVDEWLPPAPPPSSPVSSWRSSSSDALSLSGFSYSAAKASSSSNPPRKAPPPGFRVVRCGSLSGGIASASASSSPASTPPAARTSSFSGSSSASTIVAAAAPRMSKESPISSTATEVVEYIVSAAVEALSEATSAAGTPSTSDDMVSNGEAVESARTADNEQAMDEASNIVEAIPTSEEDEEVSMPAELAALRSHSSKDSSASSDSCRLVIMSDEEADDVKRTLKLEETQDEVGLEAGTLEELKEESPSTPPAAQEHEAKSSEVEIEDEEEDVSQSPPPQLTLESAEVKEEEQAMKEGKVEEAGIEGREGGEEAMEVESSQALPVEVEPSSQGASDPAREEAVTTKDEEESRVAEGASPPPPPPATPPLSLEGPPTDAEQPRPSCPSPKTPALDAPSETPK